MIVVCGAGGFIGGHLVGHLLAQGQQVRAADSKPLDEWFQLHTSADNHCLDLQLKEACRSAVQGASQVYNLACNMGGIGFIENHKAMCMLSVLINTHLLQCAQEFKVDRYFYASSACIYPDYRQSTAEIEALKESDAYPAMPEDGYGWEKLFSERMCRHFHEDFGLTTRVARFHNVYGPWGSFDGGREKAPAAICRKVIQAKLFGNHEIEIWGDGTQTRSFMYIDDCIHGVTMLMNSMVEEPLNLGSSELVSIDELVDIVEEIAGIKLKRKYNTDAPQGVKGRNSDNSLIKQYFNWEPSIPLRQGMKKTYDWIYSQLTASAEVASAV